MTLPWFTTVWGCSPWSVEQDPGAAEDLDALGVQFLTTPADIIAEPLAGENDPSTASHFAALTADWPEVGAQIPEADKISERDRETVVLSWMNATYPKQKNVTCFYMAAYQLSRKNLSPAGTPVKSEQSWFLVKEYREPDGSLRSEIQIDATVEAITYLKSALQDKRPAIAGMRYDTWLPENGGRPNDVYKTDYVVPTNHYIVIVGMGTDEYGPYFSYYDYQHDFRESDRYYLRSDLSLKGLGGNTTLVELRKSFGG